MFPILPRQILDPIIRETLQKEPITYTVADQEHTSIRKARRHAEKVNPDDPAKEIKAKTNFLT